MGKTISNIIFEKKNVKKYLDQVEKLSSETEIEKFSKRAKACLDIEEGIKELQNTSSSDGEKEESEKLSACWEEVKKSGHLFD